MLSHKIEVHPDRITVIEGTTVVASAKMETVANLLYPKTTPANFGLLPPGLRWVSADRRTFIVEQEAGHRTVCLTMPGSFETVPMPFRVAMVTFNENYDGIEGLKVFFSARPRGIHSIYDDVMPMVGATNTDLEPPSTLPLNGPATVGIALGQLFSQVDAILYKLWAATPLVPERLPGSAPTLESDYPHQEFVAWWVQQSIDEVLNWEFENPSLSALEQIVYDDRRTNESTLSFFLRIVSAAQEIEEEEERKRQEAEAAQLQAVQERILGRRKIVIPVPGEAPAATTSPPSPHVVSGNTDFSVVSTGPTFAVGTSDNLSWTTTTATSTDAF